MSRNIRPPCRGEMSQRPERFAVNASHDGTLTRVAAVTRTSDSHRLKAKLLHPQTLFSVFDACLTERYTVTSRWRPSHNGGRGGDWDKWRQRVWDGSILETSVDSSPCQLKAAVEAVENRPASMNNGSNRTIDPSCTDQPPLAIDIILSEYIFEYFFQNDPPLNDLCGNIIAATDLMDVNWLLVTLAPLQCHFCFKVTQVQQRRDRFKIRL